MKKITIIIDDEKGTLSIHTEGKFDGNDIEVAGWLEIGKAHVVQNITRGPHTHRITGSIPEGGTEENGG